MDGGFGDTVNNGKNRLPARFKTVGNGSAKIVSGQTKAKKVYKILSLGFCCTLEIQGNMNDLVVIGILSNTVVVISDPWSDVSRCRLAKGTHQGRCSLSDGFPVSFVLQ